MADRYLLPWDGETQRVLYYKGAKVVANTTIIIDVEGMDERDKMELLSSEPAAMHLVEAK